ncbi:MAG: acetyltransferase [Armatimonadota bacterium]
MRVVIIGAGGHSKVVLDALVKCGYNVLGFLDDGKDKQGEMIHGVRVIGPVENMNTMADQLPMGAFAGVGNNMIRKNVYLKLKQLGFDLVKAVHPGSYVFDKGAIGPGTLVMPKAVINIDAVIGENCIINTGAVIEHDCVIGSHTHIAPLACVAGGVKAGEGAFIGASSVILPKVKIGTGAVVGAGSVVIQDVDDFTVVAGNPARIIKKADKA